MVQHNYEDFDEDIEWHGCREYNANPYAVQVIMDTVSPSGKKAQVTITADSESVWGGDLGAGESSPVLTVDGEYTAVHIANNEYQQTLSVEGKIDWISN